MVGNSEDSLRWMMMSGKRAVLGGPYLPVLMPTSGASTVSFRCLQKKKKKIKYEPQYFACCAAVVFL